ncbi:MAG TPA: hypothetical protein VFH54_19025 [Mycobacteriales bacterium]|nr:hypothetical protein [Mycobacteriales bacterium]
MALTSSLLNRPSVRIGMAAAAITTMVAGAVTASATHQPRTLTANVSDLNWLADHATTPPLGYFDATRNLHLGNTPQAPCGPGSRPETSWQGRVPAKDYADGRAAKGYTCNTALVSHFGQSGGYRTARYVDAAGHVCAFYDSTLLFGSDVVQNNFKAGVYVLDMSNPRKLVMTANLDTPAMDTPHESLRLNTKRGLLVADAGSPATNLGFVDVYSVAKDCRHPVWESTLPIGPLGHESGFSPDGKTFWATATATNGITAIDLSNPAVPRIVWHSQDYGSHGMALSPDGKVAYLAAPCCNYFTAISGYGNDSKTGGLVILDVSAVQNRTLTNPAADLPVIAKLTWPEISIPQNVIPITIRHHPYLIEFDEFSSNVLQYNPDSAVGAARIIDIGNLHHPKVISRIRLAVHNPKERASDQQNDPGATSGTQGYAAHYCAVPRQADPGIVACSMILSGLRVFDIRDPYHPREVAYFNMPPSGGSHAMSAPAFDPARGDIWYTDGASGFWVVHVTNGAWPRSGSYPTPNF